MFKKILPKNDFLRSVLTLMTGTGIAQALPIAISPILTRIYTPEDFGVLALYVGVTSIISVIATGRYELAIVQAEIDNDAINIVALSVMIASTISLILLVIIIFFNPHIVKITGNPSIGNWLYFVPLAVLLSGINQSLIFWLNRSKKYKDIAKNRITQSTANAISQVSIGHSKLISPGLIYGSLIGQVFSTACLINLTKTSLSDIKTLTTKKNLLKNAQYYKKLPFFSSWGALLDSTALQIPIFIITRFYSATITGFFSMTFKVLNLPLTLVSGAISQVLLQKVAKIHHETPERLQFFIIKIAFILSILVLPMVLVLSLFGIQLFTFIFGAAWAEAGHYAGILSIAVAVRFIVSPLSSVLILEHNIKKGTLWQLIYFFSITTTLTIFSSRSIDYFLKVFVIHEIILYSLYFYIILMATRNHQTMVAGK